MISMTGLALVLVLWAAQAPPSVDPPETLAPVDMRLRAEIDKGTQGIARLIVRAKKDQLAAVEEAAVKLGAEVLSRHAFIGSVSIKLDMDQLRALRRHPGVASVSIDGPVEPMKTRR